MTQSRSKPFPLKSRHFTARLLSKGLVIAYALFLHLCFGRSVNAQTDTVVVPAGLENTPGNTYDDPFFFTNGPEIQSYSPDAFSALSGTPITITALAFRIDENERGSLEAVIPEVRLTMSVASGPIDINHIPNPTIVFDHQNVQFTAKNPAATPAFDIFVTLDKPFLYNPAVGSLVLQFNSHQTFGQVLGVDAQSTQLGTRYSFQVDGRPALPLAKMIVTQFSYVPVPEPGSILFLTAVVVSFFSYRKAFR